MQGAFQDDQEVPEFQKAAEKGKLLYFLFGFESCYSSFLLNFKHQDLIVKMEFYHLIKTSSLSYFLDVIFW